MKYLDNEIGIPTIEQIREYIISKKFKVNAKEVYEHFRQKKWLNNKGTPIKTLEAMVNAYNGTLIMINKKRRRYKKEPITQKVEPIVEWARKTNKTLLDNSTNYEKQLYHKLKRTFHNRVKAQHPYLINGKLYYADICIPSLKLIIEVDGGYHNTPEQRKKDKKRDEDFASIGYKVLRYSNEYVNTNNGKKQILQEILSLKKTIIC